MSQGNQTQMPEPFNAARYETMRFNRCGKSGLKLPALSLGGWHNFSDPQVARQLMIHAFDRGITHFDLANNYGIPPGSAEASAGRVLSGDFASHRDELLISTKAGHEMWPGPYGIGGSRKYLLASLDQSLRRLKLDYVDIFYSHRFDPDTPLEETMGALHQAVQSGKALYAGISNHDAAQAVEAASIMQSLGTPLLIHQAKYSMLSRQIENGVLNHCARLGLGTIAYSPLEQGLLTGKYLDGIPADSRAARAGEHPAAARLRARLTPPMVEKLRGLNAIARERGQTLARLALSWALRDPAVTSLLVGASRVEQLDDNLAALQDAPLGREELQRIEAILG